MARRGRPQKPYQSSWNVPIAGLARDRDGRWRVLATGQRFTEHDERRAVARFYEMTRAARVQQMHAAVPAQTINRNGKPLRRSPSLVAMDRFVETLKCDNPVTILIDRLSGTAAMSQEVNGAILADWLKEQLTEHPGWVANLVGIPELVSLRHFEIPKASITVKQVIEEYGKHSTATPKSKREAIRQFQRLVKFTAARTLDEATSDQALIDFRQQITHDPELKSTDTIRAYLARIRGVIRIAGRGKLDAVQINRAVTRCQAKLYAPQSTAIDNPHPISREDFHKLLNGRFQTDIPQIWAAMLLMGLNCCLYMEDLCDLNWTSVDLQAKTYLARRKKRGRCIRAAVLWDETVEALLALKRRASSPYLFTSSSGTRYNKNTKINDFKDFREKVGVRDVTFSHIRDGAYTAACHAPAVDGRYARLLAGHKAHGLEDKYVLRCPQVVKPACDAVYKAYFL